MHQVPSGGVGSPDAVTACMLEGSKLVKVKSADRQSFIWKYLEGLCIYILINYATESKVWTFSARLSVEFALTFDGEHFSCQHF